MAGTFEQRQERARQLYDALIFFRRHGPLEPMATREQVLEIPCVFCGAEAGSECSTRFPRPAMFAGMALRGLSGVHMRRYQDRAHDPR